MGIGLNRCQFKYLLLMSSLWSFPVADTLAAPTELALGVGLQGGTSAISEVQTGLRLTVDQGIALQIQGQMGVSDWRRLSGALCGEVVLSYDVFRWVPYLSIGSGFRWGKGQGLLGRANIGVQWYWNAIWALAAGVGIEGSGGVTALIFSVTVWGIANS